MVDMRDEVVNNYDIISRKLEMRINEVLENNRQVMLILDNKGYSSTITCRRCKKTVKCPKCQISLTCRDSIKSRIVLVRQQSQWQLQLLPS